MLTGLTYRGLACALLLAGLPAAEGAQIATLVQDLNRDGAVEAASSSPRDFFTLGDRVVFFAKAGESTGVWVTDGTAPGTQLIAPACGNFQLGCSSRNPIRAGGHLYWRSPPSDATCDRDQTTLYRTDGTKTGTLALTGCDLSVAELLFALDDRLLFLAQNRSFEMELWVTDGTTPGTLKLTDTPGAHPQGGGLALAGHLVVFPVRRSSENELWRTDGTPAGTFRIDPPQLGDFSVFPQPASDRILFLGQDLGGRSQLWTTDGSEVGTRAVTTLPAATGEMEDLLRVTAGRAYFVVRSPSHHYDLWISDGTSGGTHPITNLALPPSYQGYSPFLSVLPVGRRVAFLTLGGDFDERRLWATDGRPESTTLLRSFLPDEGARFNLDVMPVVLDTQVLFLATLFGSGSQLWTTDGTLGGTHPLVDLNPQGSDAVSGLLQVGGTTFFLASDPPLGLELYRTDGTPPGTRRVTNFSEPLPFPPFSELCAFNQGCRIGAFRNGWLLGASQSPNGDELWFTNGNPGGTRLVADLALSAPGSEPRLLRALGSRAIFVASVAEVDWLFSSEDAPETTGAATPLLRLGPTPSSVTADLVTSGSYAYFVAEPPGEFRGLFRTDGTVTGTVRLTGEQGSGPALGEGSSLIAVGPSLYFTSYDGTTTDLWRSDGSPAGTELLFGIGELVEPVPETFTTFDGEIYFVGRDPDHGKELWKTDGSLAGTIRLTDFGDPGAFSRGTPHYAVSGGQLFFTARLPNDYDCFVLRTDGTAQGTRILLDLIPEDRIGLEIFPFGERLFFLTTPDSEFSSLYQSDGTAEGTFEVTRFGWRQPFSESTGHMAVHRDTLFFVAGDPEHGPEVWKTDGTDAGTVRVTDLRSGSFQSVPESLTAAGGRLFFTADDGVHGRELWVTSGTAGGSRILHDIAPGPDSSRPAGLTVAGSRLYFSADDRVSGRELWSLDLEADPGRCPPSELGLCLQGDRFRAEIAWRTPQGLSGFGQPVQLTADTGYFWFFNPANVEAIVKLLDGRPLNGHHWTFYGALSNVEYSLTVTDAATGLTRRYFNPQGRLASVGDTTSFGPLGTALESFTPPAEELAVETTPLVDKLFRREATGACAPASNRLCLNGSRFAVEAAWRDFAGNTGVGTAVPLTADTGYFWFFRNTNVEVVLKVLDGRPVNGKFWVFYGALSNVEYTLTVTDTTTGAVKTYFNPAHQFASVADTAAF